MDNEISLMDLANNANVNEKNPADILKKYSNNIEIPIIDEFDKRNKEDEKSKENIPSQLDTVEETDETLYKNPNKNYGHYKDAADKGDIDAAYKLAMVYKTDKKTIFDKNPKEQAAKYFEIAANGGNSKAAYNLAFYYLNGDGVEKNEEKALEYFKKTPDDEVYIEGICRIADKNIKENKELAIKLYDIIADKYRKIGDKIEALKYSKKAFDNKISKKVIEETDNKQIIKETTNKIPTLLEEKYKKEFENIKSKVDKGSTKEIYSLAYHYLNGIGVEKNEEKALEYFKQAPDDEVSIEGICRIADKNIKENKLLAIKLYKIAMNKYKNINNSIKNKELEIKLNNLENAAEEKVLNKERANSEKDVRVY